MVVLLSGPSYSFSDGTFGCSGWSLILNCMILFGVNYILTIGEVVMSVIYCDPKSGSLMSCNVWRICGVAVWHVVAGPVTVFSVCWTGSSWAASMVAVPVPLLWSAPASMQVMTAGSTMFAVSRLWSGLVSSFSSQWFLELNLVWWFLCALLCGTSVPKGGILWGQSMMRCLCSSHSWHLMWVAVLCEVSWFFALGVLVFLIGHHVDHWRWNDCISKLLCCIEFLYFCDGVH